MPDLYLSPTVRIRDKGGGKSVLEWNNTATGSWEEKIRLANDTGNVEVMGEIAGLAAPWFDPDNYDCGVLNDFTNFSSTTIGSGAVTQVVRRAAALTGTTANSAATIYRDLNPSAEGASNWTKKHELIFVAMLQTATANGKAYLGFGRTMTSTPGDPTNSFMGFRVDNLALRGLVHDGTNLYVIDLGLELGRDEGHLFKVLLIPGSKIEFYLDGAKKGETDHYIPSGAPTFERVGIWAENNGDEASQGLAVVQITYKIERYH